MPERNNSKPYKPSAWANCVQRCLQLCLPMLLLLTNLTACSHKSMELRLHALAENGTDISALQSMFEAKSHLRLLPTEHESSQSGLELLARGEVDLTVVENSSPFQAGVRAVIPIYKSVLHLLVRDGVNFSDPQQPLRGNSIFVMEGSPAGKAFVEMVVSRQGLQAGEYQIVSELTPGETDVIVYFGPISPRNPTWYVAGYRLYSLNYDDAERAMSTKAIAYLMPQMQPKVIPAHTYDLPGNKVNVYTVEVDALLATHKDASVNAIYELTRTLLQQKPRFTAIAPEVFAGVREDFDPL